MLSKNQNDLLNICATALFGKENQVKEIDFDKLADEAKQQAILPLIENELSAKHGYSHEEAIKIVAKNIKIHCSHNEIHELMTRNNIRYVMLKGVASSSYYKQPMLRTMGDVDLLVRADDFEKCDELLCSIGYVRDVNIDIQKNHVVYKKAVGNNIVILEMHHSVNGIPEGSEATINKYLSDIYDSSYLYTVPNSACLIPGKFHHGLILLLHTAAHLTSEGIGLRHLCDWAVYVDNFSNDEFVDMFEEPLKEIGIWKFAQLLTICCIKYLGCDEQKWVGEADDELIEGIIRDIYESGNFGLKDIDRYRQIKYIKNRNDKTVDSKKSVFQVFYTINSKAHCECEFVKKHKYLLPIGWVAVVFRYFGKVIKGKREIDSISTISNADSRKKLYSKFHLFEKN